MITKTEIDEAFSDTYKQIASRQTYDMRLAADLFENLREHFHHADPAEAWDNVAISKSRYESDEALNYLYSETTCDVILSDVIMPQMSGVELAQRARDARPGIPLVFVTGKTGGIELVADAGCLALLKPVSRERLAQVLEEALD